MDKKIRLAIIVLAVLLVTGASLVWYLQLQRNTGPDAQNNAHNSANSSSTATGPSPTAPVATASVDIKDMAYSPSKITVKKGTTVTWTNQDSAGHNVVADDAAHSGGLPTTHALLKKGETFSFTFNEAGTFNYHCTPHLFMHGSVEVTE